MGLYTQFQQKRKIRQRIEEEASCSWSYLTMNVLATVMATYGLFSNSQVVIIGAMIVAMLLGPIVGISLSLVDNNKNLLLKGVDSLAHGIISVFVVAFFLGIVHRDIPLTNEIFMRTTTSVMDLMIALSGGAAAAFATVSTRFGSAFIGVAVATAIVPPLAASAILLARGEIHLGIGALFLAFVNMAAVQFAASVVLWIVGFRKITKLNGGGFQVFLKRSVLYLFILFVLGTDLSLNFQQVLAR